MAAEDEIIIEDDAPGGETPKGMSTDPDDVIAELKAQLQASEAVRAAHEQRALQAQAQAQAAHTDAQDSRMALVATALDTVKQNSEVLKQNYAAALSAGDFTAAAEFQEQLADNAAKRLQLEEGKRQMEEDARRPRPAPPPQIVDPVESMAKNLSQRSADWVRAHPEFARNPKLTTKMVSAHNIALADDLQPDTDAYFDRVETILGLKRPPRAQAARIEAEGDDDPLSEASAPVQARQPAAAPVNASSNGSKLSVRLSADQREMAANMGMTDQEYAKYFAALKKEGKIK